MCGYSIAQPKNRAPPGPSLLYALPGVLRPALVMALRANDSRCFSFVEAHVPSSSFLSPGPMPSSNILRRVTDLKRLHLARLEAAPRRQRSLKPPPQPQSLGGARSQERATLYLLHGAGTQQARQSHCNCAALAETAECTKQGKLQFYLEQAGQAANQKALPLRELTAPCQRAAGSAGPVGCVCGPRENPQTPVVFAPGRRRTGC